MGETCINNNSNKETFVRSDFEVLIL